MGENFQALGYLIEGNAQSSPHPLLKKNITKQTGEGASDVYNKHFSLDKVS